MKQAIEEIEKETLSVDKLLVDEEDDKKSENGEKNLVNDKENAKKKGSDYYETRKSILFRISNRR